VYTLALSLAILGIIVTLLLVMEVGNYRARRTLITRRRLLLRVAAGLMLLALLSGVFVGVFVLRIVDAQSRPQLFLTYWSGCLLLAIALVWVMLMDLREVEDRFKARQREIWRDMARFVVDQMNAERAGGAGSKDEQRE
jgi:cytochrome c biogenesis protein CcdA